MKKCPIYFALFFLLSSFLVSTNDNLVDIIEKKLKRYSDVDWPEKVYLHTDKDLYFPNESIWFSAYLVNGITNQKSTKSAVLYIELINDKDSIISKRKLYIDDTSTGGDFKIEEEWETGKYQLRAYTNYMRNQDPEYFFKKEIDIWELSDTQNSIGLKNSTSTEISEGLDRLDLNFYPESGDLVENLTSKVAIKIKNNIDAKNQLGGYIVDEDGNLISDFSIADYGLGHFYIKPKPYKTYYANLEVDGSVYKYQLPKALPLGYSLGVSYIKNKLLINIKTTEAKGLVGSYLIIHQKGEILYENLEIKNINSNTIRLSTEGLQNGVTHITLFNAKGHPVCERLVFIDNPENLATIKIKNYKEVLSTKENVELELNVDDYIGKSLPSYLSLSVRNSNTNPYNSNSQNIKSWLLLNSDLRGEIKNPGYFFSETKDLKRKYLLDLVMMTNGWRRFTWQNLLNGENKTSQYNIEKGIVISGETKLLKKPYTQTPAYISLTFLNKEIPQQITKKSSIDGKFSFGPFVFYDTIPTILESRLTGLKSKNDKDRELSILIDEDIPSPIINRNSNKKTHLTKTDKSSNYSEITKYIRDINFQFDQNSEKLKEVVVIAKKKPEKTLREQEMDDISRFDFPSFRLDVESDKTLENKPIVSLLSRFPGLFFNGRGFSSRGGGNPKIIIDDRTTDLEELMSIPPNQISFIDYFRGTDSAIFSNAYNGVISVYTKRGNSTSKEKRKPGIINFNTKGFYTAKEFYSPDYSQNTFQNSQYDLRKTLYWNPRIRITDQNKTQLISFFTGDIKGDYIIEVEGVTDSGIPLHQISSFSVD